MSNKALSICFCTNAIDPCRKFYEQHFAAKAVFDCGWYLTLKLDQTGPEISFIQPQEGMTTFSGAGVTLNLKVADVDAEFSRLNQAGLEVQMPLEDHPWGDRGFSVVDPLGNSVYLYSEREPTAEFKSFFVE